jgi:hypothetical protein
VYNCGKDGIEGLTLVVVCGITGHLSMEEDGSDIGLRALVAGS